jgi:type III pantothenate kinase
MAVLLIDVGNTRIKWARLEGGRLRGSRAAVHALWRTADYGRRLLGAARGLERILVSSVAGPVVHRRLAAAARRAGIPIAFVAVPARGGAISVGYAEPWRLGVDRFVGLVGAHQLLPGVPVLVAGIGTALTLDLLSGAGRHLGGAIIPAPALMVDTLLARTHGIRRRAQGGEDRAAGLFGRSTRAGILAGSRYAAAALIDRALEEAAPRTGRRPLIVLTGGGAGPVRPLLRGACVGVPDLVLQGLAVLSRQPARR